MSPRRRATAARRETCNPASRRAPADPVGQSTASVECGGGAIPLRAMARPDAAVQHPDRPRRCPPGGHRIRGVPQRCHSLADDLLTGNRRATPGRAPADPLGQNTASVESCGGVIPPRAMARPDAAVRHPDRPRRCPPQEHRIRGMPQRRHSLADDWLTGNRDATPRRAPADPHQERAASAEGHSGVIPTRATA